VGRELAKFRNPSNGYVEETTPVGAFFGAFGLGLIFFAVKGLWPHVFAILLMIVLSVMTGPFAVLLIPVMWLIYAFAAHSIIVSNYLKKGWARVDGTAVAGTTPPVPDTKTCPECAETVKAAATKCRYCGHAFSQPSTPTSEGAPE
jgi:hypothetical protein